VLLWVVLGLVLVSFGLLVVALATTRTGWAWGSVATSAAAGALLGAEWLARRRATRAAEPPPGVPYLEGRFADEPEPGVLEPLDEAPAAEPDGDATPAGATEARIGEPSQEAAERDAEAQAPAGAAAAGAVAAAPAEPAADATPAGPAAADGTPAEPAAGTPAEPAAAAATPVGQRAASTRWDFDPQAEPDEERTDVGDVIAIADLPDEVRVIDERPRYHLISCRWVGPRDTIPLPISEARELGFTPCAICRPDSTLAARRRKARAT
jgi:hypothetical protein